MPASIHLYRPQRTAPEDLEEIFVAREPLLQEMLERLQRWQPGATRQHYLLIGPRGIGKTCVLKLFEHRIRQNDLLHKKLLPISLAEETYGITNVADLLVEAIRILSDQTGDKNLKNIFDSIRFDHDHARVVDLSLDAFRRFCREHECGIVLMVENVNRLFERQMKRSAEIHLLRKLLIEEDWLIMICTSPTFLNAVQDPGKPLFEFFHVQFLPELTPVEQQQLLNNLALLEQNRNFEMYLEKFRSRLQALYHFTGGNPRLTVMLYDLVANHNITEMQSELDLLLDQLTPFYQDRMKDISEQEAKILETMALMAEGCTPTELAQHARMAGEQVRALLTRLERAGYIRREQRRKKRTVYTIPERFFRIWHQMNHSRAARGRLQYLLEFFTTWYASSDEREHGWNALMGEFQSGAEAGDDGRLADLAEYMEYVAVVSEDSEKFDRIFELLRQTVRIMGSNTVKQKLADFDREYHADGDYFLHKGYFLANDLGWHEKAVQAFEIANELKLDSIEPLFNLAVAYDKLGNKPQADKAYNKVINFLTNRQDKDSPEENQDLLLEILRETTNSNAARMSGLLLGRTARKETANDIIIILEESDCPWRRQHCATGLGLLGAEKATPILIKYLRDKANNVRGSAATALGRIGSVKAVEPLLICMQDTAENVRISAAMALAFIALEKQIPKLTQVASVVLHKFSDGPKRRLKLAVRGFLRSAFRSGDVETIHEVLGIVQSRLPNAEALCAPYTAALAYLQSNRDPAVMERQHQEMREAVQLLIELFDEGDAH